MPITELTRPLISVIIPTYNAASTLQRAIDSVMGQVFCERELIVIDGASTDQTMNIILRNESELSEWISDVDAGNYEALNKGVCKATGQWIYILGADDYLWSPDVLTFMAPHLIKDAGKHGIVYGKVAYVNASGETLQLVGEPWESARRYFFDRMTLPHQGVFHHRSLFERHGMFNETFRMAGDYEFLLRELKTGQAVFVSNVIVAGYQYGGGSSVPENGLKVLQEFRRAQKLNGFSTPSLHWLGCYVRTWLRMLVWFLFGAKRAALIIDWLRRLFGLPNIWTRL
jgi:glycosyltransferase involved in cell wall biosynthesis